MKTFVFGVVIAITTLTACSNNNSTKKVADTKDSTVSTQTGDAKNIPVNQSASLDEALEHYLHIKNALANDDAKDAAEGGNAFVQAIDKINNPSLTADQKDVLADAKEMADHIGKNADKIDHQREHFDMLSTDMYDMLKASGTSKTVYKDFCPMYNNKKGASWLSETREIKNPYMGKKMQTCGEVKEEIVK